MTVLVSGASGRVGANMVKRLVDDGRTVTSLVMPGDPQAAKLAELPRVRIAEADLGDQAAIDSACIGVTQVVHLAAQLIRGDTPVDRFYDVNALGTLRLLEGALRHGKQLERFVLVSTDGTYRPGEPPAVPLAEDTVQVPADYYGTSKLLGEVILRNHAAQFDIPFSIVRFATVMSPDEAPRMFQVGKWRDSLGKARRGRDSNIWQLFRKHPELPKLFEDAVAGAADDDAVCLTGPDGAPWTTHVCDVRDAVQGVYRALTEPAGAEGGAYNIAAPDPTSHEEGAAVLAEAYGRQVHTVTLPIRWRLELDISAARRDLGFEPRYDYRAMVDSAGAGELADRDAFIPARI
ncbi:MAG: hypothetical protein V7607_5622 [Solirubrobacteraceae bacterium]